MYISYVHTWQSTVAHRLECLALFLQLPLIYLTVQLISVGVTQANSDLPFRLQVNPSHVPISPQFFQFLNEGIDDFIEITVNVTYWYCTNNGCGDLISVNGTPRLAIKNLLLLTNSWQYSRKSLFQTSAIQTPKIMNDIILCTKWKVFRLYTIVLFHLTKHFSYLNTSWSQHVWISDFLLCLC